MALPWASSTSPSVLSSNTGTDTYRLKIKCSQILLCSGSFRCHEMTFSTQQKFVHQKSTVPHKHSSKSENIQWTQHLPLDGISDEVDPRGLGQVSPAALQGLQVTEVEVAVENFPPRRRHRLRRRLLAQAGAVGAALGLPFVVHSAQVRAPKLVFFLPERQSLD